MCYSGACQFENYNGTCHKPFNAKCPEECEDNEEPFDAWENAQLERAESENIKGAYDE